LLQHELGNEDPIGIRCFTPWQLSSVTLKPRAEGSTKRRAFEVI
jgi:hypothetical protein